MSGKSKDNRPKKNFGGTASQNQGSGKQQGGKKGNSGNTKNTGKRS